MTSEATSRDFLTPTAAILLPAGQAAVSAFAIGVTSGSLAALFHAPDPWAIGGVAGGVGLGASWLVGLSWWRQRVEGLKPAPALTYPEEVTRVELARNTDTAYLWVEFLDIPLGRETMQAAAVDILAKNYQTSNLGGRGKALTRSQAEALRDYLIYRKLGYWIRPGSPTVGWALNSAGEALIRQFANIPLPHQAAGLPDGWRSLKLTRTHTDALNP